MTSSGRGYLFIFNVQRDRVGSEVDMQNLSKTFKAMGAEVAVRNDPGGREVKQIMAEIKKKDFTDYLYVAVAYFSHGAENDLVSTASNFEIIKAQKSILIPLCNIPSLDGKLKWLIMQTCRGSYDFIKQTSEGAVSAIEFPKYCAKFFATSPGKKAYRTANGSWFIQALCERLEKEHKDLDIISIMGNVKQDVENLCKATPNFPLVQIPEAEENFAGKKFFITSGFTES